MEGRNVENILSVEMEKNSRSPTFQDAERINTTDGAICRTKVLEPLVNPPSCSTAYLCSTLNGESADVPPVARVSYCRHETHCLNWIPTKCTIIPHSEDNRPQESVVSDFRCHVAPSNAMVHGVEESTHESLLVQQLLRGLTFSCTFRYLPPNERHNSLFSKTVTVLPNEYLIVVVAKKPFLKILLPPDVKVLRFAFSLLTESCRLWRESGGTWKLLCDVPCRIPGLRLGPKLSQHSKDVGFKRRKVKPNTALDLVFRVHVVPQGSMGIGVDFTPLPISVIESGFYGQL